jgi:hypothetical protein
MAADLPTGTVTFLFTDIEGSTKLLQRVGVSATARSAPTTSACFARPGPSTTVTRWIPRATPSSSPSLSPPTL